MTEQAIRKLIIESGKRLIRENLVQGTWGNISVRVDDDYMIITPSGMDYERLQESDLVLMNIHTMEYEGNKPSSEKDVHAGILASRKDVNAVIHSHPAYCSSVASTRKEVQVKGEKEKALIGETIKVAKYALPSTKALGKSTLAAMENRNGCFMANHGVISCGKDLEEAFNVIKAMEGICKEYIESAVREKAGREYSFEDMAALFVEKHKK